MKIQYISIVLLIATLMITACGNLAATTVEPTPIAATQVTLKISGSGSTTAILTAIKPAFEADTPGYKLEVLPGSGTGGGIKGIIDGILDVAAMARPPKDEETAQNVAYEELGQAGFAVITQPQVNVTSLTTDQILAIFAGDVTNWSEVGGPDLPLILYVRDDADSTTQALRSTIMGEKPFGANVVQVFTSQGDMLTAVAGTPGSVGLATWPTALASGSQVQAVAIAGIAPGDPTYPMLGPLGIGYLVDRQAEVQPLIDWLRTEKGRTALQDFDMVIQ